MCDPMLISTNRRWIIHTGVKGGHLDVFPPKAADLLDRLEVVERRTTRMHFLD